MPADEAHVWGVWKLRRITIDEAAARAVLDKHQGLIRFFLATAKLPRSVAFDREDLLAVCQMTLLQAHASYDPEKGAFSTWAYIWLKQAFFDCGRRARGLLRREQAIRSRARQIEEYERAVRTGRWKGVEPPAPLTELELSILVASERRTVVSLQAPVGDTSGLGDNIEDTIGAEDEIVERVHDNLIREWLYKKLGNGILTERQREVMRCALDDRSTSEIAIDLGISRQAVEAHYNEAISRLRVAARRERLER